MISSSPGPAKHWVAGAFCVLLVVGGVAPSPAWAGCGRDVTSKASRSTRDSLSALELLKSSAAEPADSAPAGPRPDRPCSDPSCSRGRGLPQTPAPSSPVKSDPWYCTTIALWWGSPRSAEPLGNLSASHPRHSTSPIERPPHSTPAHALLIPRSHPTETDRSLRRRADPRPGAHGPPRARLPDHQTVDRSIFAAEPILRDRPARGRVHARHPADRPP